MANGKHHHCNCDPNNQHNHEHKHTHGHHDHNCSCGHNHNHKHHNHPAHSAHDKDSCPVCSGAETITPEQTLQRIEEAVAKIPRTKKKERLDRIIVLTAGTAASAAEHQDFTMLQIAEVYLTLSLAEESGQALAPEEASLLFREISKMVGLGLTAKYGLEGLLKVGFEGNHQPGPASLVFITCYAIGKLLSIHFKLQTQGSALTAEDAKEKFKAAKAEAERIASSIQIS